MITKILNKYEGFANDWYPDVKEKNLYTNSIVKEKYSKGCHELESKLLKKWKSYIPLGWYGFSLGEPCPHAWYKIIDEFLKYFVKLQNDKKISKFEIHQIKIKYGGLRFFVSWICDDEEMNEFLRLQIDKLESYLHDDKLIY
jgi:hypothetical protein